MPRHIRRTPANLVALAIIVAILGAWVGVMLRAPGSHSHHAAASGAGSSEHTHSEPPGSVAERIKAEALNVQFCVSAALEPFEGALAQLRADGPDEATERFRQCLLDTMFDHTSDETIVELDTHRAQFLACFRDLAGVEASDKLTAVQSTLACVEQTTN